MYVRRCCENKPNVLYKQINLMVERTCLFLLVFCTRLQRKTNILVLYCQNKSGPICAIDKNGKRRFIEICKKQYNKEETKRKL